MRILNFFLYVVLLIILFISCRESKDPIAPEKKEKFSDQDLFNAVYTSYKYPPDFYHEDLQGAGIYYNNTVSITPPDQREASWIQLCTDDRNQALQWSEQTSLNSAYYRKLVSERETEKYFEFKRVYEVNPRDIILSRVHKCSYLDRSMYDFFNPGEIIGKYNKRPFILAEVKELIEYLWFIGEYQHGGRTVLESSISEIRENYCVILYETDFMGGDWGMRDIIYLLKTTYLVNKNTGEITRDEELIRSIEGKMN
ncbi:MAG: hypothetical protein EH225_04295 [Calditrichaeota bacterium]|nr:hypothetical protein [Calditrichota bacterium]RQW05805.1 MAG: hypothetical protein EH225_04295 [Calditrichota bacterium]